MHSASSNPKTRTGKLEAATQRTADAPSNDAKTRTGTAGVGKATTLKLPAALASRSLRARKLRHGGLARRLRLGSVSGRARGAAPAQRSAHCASNLGCQLPGGHHPNGHHSLSPALARGVRARQAPYSTMMLASSWVAAPESESESPESARRSPGPEPAFPGPGRLCWARGAVVVTVCCVQIGALASAASSLY